MRRGRQLGDMNTLADLTLSPPLGDEETERAWWDATASRKTRARRVPGQFTPRTDLPDGFTTPDDESDAPF